MVTNHDQDFVLSVYLMALADYTIYLDISIDHPQIYD